MSEVGDLPTGGRGSSHRGRPCQQLCCRLSRLHRSHRQYPGPQARRGLSRSKGPFRQKRPHSRRPATERGAVAACCW